MADTNTVLQELSQIKQPDDEYYVPPNFDYLNPNRDSQLSDKIRNAWQIFKYMFNVHGLNNMHKVTELFQDYTQLVLAINNDPQTKQWYTKIAESKASYDILQSLLTKYGRQSLQSALKQLQVNRDSLNERIYSDEFQDDDAFAEINSCLGSDDGVHYFITYISFDQQQTDTFLKYTQKPFIFSFEINKLLQDIVLSSQERYMLADNIDPELLVLMP